jgi:hypothetical protein
MIVDVVAFLVNYSAFISIGRLFSVFWCRNSGEIRI